MHRTLSHIRQNLLLYPIAEQHIKVKAGEAGLLLYRLQQAGAELLHPHSSQGVFVVREKWQRVTLTTLPLPEHKNTAN